MSTIGRRLVVATLTLALCACSGSGAPTSLGGPPLASPAQRGKALVRLRPLNSSGKIQHVVIIVQENRSFDNLFHGARGADTRSWGYDSLGQKIKLVPIGLETRWDIDHSSNSYFQACDGQGSFPGTNCKMDGFDKEWTGCGSGCPYKHPQYGYVPKSEIAPYFAMAKQYVLTDRMFASNFDGSSFISHQYIIGAQAGSAVNYPSGQWGCDGGPGDTIRLVTQQRQIQGQEPACFDNTTLGDELDGAGISWGFFTAALNGNGGIWSAYQAIRHIRYGNDWNKDIITPQTQFFSAIQDGNLPTVSWVTPTCEHSDHAGCGSASGPAWVASLVNAVGQSKYWSSTAIFIMWDDYGGWYDHVPPPLVDYDGLGIRIPLLIVSPYAKRGFVSHVQYEHGSILRFIEDQFGLARLSASDARANSPEADCFDFTKPPRKFSAIPSLLDAHYFMHQPPDRRPPDTE